MNCKKCNSPLNEDAIFCQKCGARVNVKDADLRGFLLRTSTIVVAIVLVIGLAAGIYLTVQNQISKNEQIRLEQSQQQKQKEIELLMLKKHADVIQNLNERYFEEFQNLREWLGKTPIIPNKKVNDYPDVGYFLDFVLADVQPARDEYMVTEQFLKSSFSTNNSDVEEYYRLVKILYQTFDTQYYSGENEFECSVDRYYELYEQHYNAVNSAYQQCQNWISSYYNG